MKNTMPMIKTDEERARLDAIFAEIEAIERGEVPVKAYTRTQEQIAADNRQAKIDRLAGLNVNEFLGNVKANAGNNAFRTKWEKILAKFVIDTVAPMNAELNLLRQFARSVDIHLEKAERSAREQDNHHYYKIFAESVKSMLEKL